MYKREILQRSIATLFTALTAGLLGIGYYNSTFYNGPVSRDAASFSIIDLLIFILVAVFLKFILFDLLAQSIIKKRKSKHMQYIFYVGYVVALLVDLFSLFMSYKPIYLNLSIFGAIAYSPILMFITIILLLVSLPLTAKRSLDDVRSS